MSRRLRLPLVFAAAVAVTVLAAIATSAQQPTVITPGGMLPVLDSYLEPLRQQAGIPGMSAAVLSEGQIVWERGYGFQNIATRERATPDTPYMVGDMSGTLAAVLASAMVVMDSTIAGVALPHMQASTGATSSQIMWVMTSYMVATAISLPLSGWLASRFGKQPVMLASLACAIGLRYAPR